MTDEQRSRTVWRGGNLVPILIVAVLAAVVVFALQGVRSGPSGASPEPTATAPEASVSPAPTTPGATASPTAALPDKTPSALPEELVGKTWLAEGPGDRWTAGMLGGQATLTLPIGELGLAAADGLVVSAANGETKATLFVRNIASGTIVFSLETDVTMVQGALLVGTRLYWSGAVGPGWPGLDGGLQVADIEAGPESARTLIPAKPFEPDRSERRVLLLSPSRTLLGSSVCGFGACDLDVVDLASGLVTRRFTGVVPYLLSDDTLYAIRTDGGESGNLVDALDIASRKVRWTLAVGRLYQGYLVAGGATLIQGYVRGGRNGIAAIDTATGDERVLLEGSPLFLWPELSGERAAALIPELTLDQALALTAGGGATEMRIFDLTDGSLRATSITVAVP